jgi:hypothetical protein
MGLNEGPSIQRITIHSPQDLQGSSGSLIFTVMNIGCVLGVAVFSAVAAAGSAGGTYTGSGIALACLAGAGISVLAFAASVLARDTVPC